MSGDASASYRWRLASLALAMLLPSMGTSIANVALPSLKTAFGVSSLEVQWVVISYLLTVTATLVSIGRLGDLFGRRRLLLAGIGLFAVASAGAMLAPTLWILIAARGIQGIGAAAMMSMTVAIVGDVAPAERTGTAMGLLGTVSAIGTAAGPSLGGILIASLGWPSVFAFMAATGVLAFSSAYIWLPKQASSRVGRLSFDLAGTVLLVISVAAFALATTTTGLPGANALLAAISAVALAGFVVVERSASAPLVQLGLLQNRTVGAGLASNGIVSAIVMTTLVVGPFYLASALELGPAMTGLVMTIGPAVAALTGIPAGRLVDRLGSSVTTVIGLAGVLLGTLLMLWLPRTFGVIGYSVSLMTITAGYALFQAANSTSVVASAGKDQRGVTSALLALARNIGLIAGASAMGSVFAWSSSGLHAPGLPPDGEIGLQVTFVVAAILAGLALALAIWGGRRATQS